MSKRKAWLIEYFKCWNATEAARRVHYKWPDKIGPRNKQKLQAEIDARLDEMAMPANEVLARLGEIAGADMSEFITNEGAINWEAVKKNGRLIKRIVHQKGQRSTIELHDALATLMHLDRYHGGTKGKPLPQVVEVTDVSPRTEIMRRLAGIASRDGTDPVSE